MANIPPEIRFIYLASLPCPTPRQCKEIADIALEVKDWELVWTTCRGHGTLPLLARNLKLFNDPIPQDIQHGIRNFSLQNAARSLYHTGVLFKLLDVLEEKSILCVPFKGPLLAQLAYDDFSLRSYCDLDLLIFEDDLCRTAQILEQQGFKPELVCDSDGLRAFAKTEDNLTFVRSSDDIMVEVHWELSGCYLTRALGLAEMESRLLPFSVANRSVQSFCWEDLIVYLSIHGAKHQWQRLEWIYSFGEIVRRGEKRVDWPMILTLAEGWRCQRMLMLGLLLVKDIAGVDLPECLLRRIEQDPSIAGLAANVQAGLFELEGGLGNTEKWVRFSNFHLQVRDSYVDVFQYGLRLLFSPTLKEWQRWPLPPSMRYLYCILRPIRIGLDFLSRMNKSKVHFGQ